MKIVEYIQKDKSPFGSWFSKLNAEAAAKITKFLGRLALGNFSNVEGVGLGAFELKIH